MYNDLSTLSPEEKLQQFKELNEMVPDGNSYLNYIPNTAPVIEPQSLPTINFEAPSTDNLNSNSINNTVGVIPKSKDAEKELDNTLEDNPFDIDTILNKKATPLMVPYKDTTENRNSKIAMDYYVKHHNLPKHIAAGIIGNLYRESGLKTNIKEQGGTGNGRGIAQWDVRNRWPALIKWAKDNGRDPLDLYTQLDYILVEPGWGNEALQKMSLAKNVSDATMIFGRSYERPKEEHAAWNIRIQAANRVFGS